MLFFQRLYEGTMIMLVVLTIMTIWTNNPFNQVVNWAVWGIFVVDFSFRFTKAERKWEFIKQNPFLLIAVIPLDQFFQMARIVRVVYLFRIKTVTKYYIQPIIDKATYQSKVVILGLLLLLLIIKSLFLWGVEDKVITLQEAFIFIIKHLMFFGHRSIEVTQFGSIIIFVLTTILGVVLHGIALQWFFTRAEEIYKHYKHRKSNERQEHI
ncbi:transporter [Alkalihalobacillus sp. BA299]|uniref:transporter n=1 Tax=Alkalihalobacillus sp. BA299 TaxID=2815938 RepID=UPI001ADBDDCF|nr:transporter [Alkalihalobacillus sp. BA299]